MNCLDYRRALETEPQRVTPEMQAHAQACADCTAWTGEMRVFEGRLRRALAIGVPPARDLSLPRVTSVSRRFALAASLLGGIALASLIWLSFPRDTLAAEVVAHVAQEPQSWLSHEALPLPAVDEVLKRSNSSAHFVPGSVTYAQNCWFRGHLVPHLVVRDPEGAVTVLILASERVSRQGALRGGGLPRRDCASTARQPRRAVARRHARGGGCGENVGGAGSVSIAGETNALLRAAHPPCCTAWLTSW